MNTIQKDAITGKLQNELIKHGHKCRAQRLVFFTEKPINSVSKWTGYDYITSLGEKGALKLYEELRTNYAYGNRTRNN